ncbi:MAG: hypothetical protein RQ723_03180 [Desulfuromonadales bacterium]|nr:hypothetical protein [Desulfuromonadales bacterium]
MEKEKKIEMAPSVAPTRLIPVTEWEKHHMWPPTGGLRHLIFHEKTNGFDSCVIRAGRRVLIDEEKFFEWARNRGNSH